jgi:OmcA/MtrC family decaheme c-type cytochrome
MLAAAAANPAATNTAANPAQAFALVQAPTAGNAAPVVVQSPPVVNFTVIDAAGKFVPGLKLVVDAGKADPACSTSATATTGNVTLAMAKLNQPTGTSPSTWQSLISRQRYAADDLTPRYGSSDTAKLYPTYRYAVAEGTTDPKPTATVTNPDGADKDASKRIVGILEENTAGGYYTYRFAMDVVNPLLFADAVDSANGVSGKVANNGNVAVKDGTTVHRVGLQLCYTDPASKAAVVVNPYYDFTLDANGNSKPVVGSDGTTPTDIKKVVDKASCNECHSTLKVHGTRVEPNYCVICHNPGSTDYNTNNPIDLKLMVHRIHMGKELVKDYQVASLRIKFTDKNGVITGTGYPQDVKNCTKCHTGTAAAAGSTSGTNATANGDNWKMVPSVNACGACHNGIDFAKNTGVTLADAAAGKTSSSPAHIGGAKADDTQCAICHGVSEIPVYHETVTPVWNSTFTTLTDYAGQKSLPAGAAKLAYEISSVTVSGTPAKASVKFRILKDGTPVTFETFAAGGTAYLKGFTGGPSIYVAMAIPQDGVTAPSDWNKYISSSVQNLWDGTKGTLSARDADGYYTATLGAGVAGTTYDIPTTAGMVTAALGLGSFTQTAVTDTDRYPNGVQLAAQVAKMTATGYTARRPIADTAKCNTCHENLGLFTGATFHSGNRNDPSVCAICHNPNRASSGWSADSTAFIHAIHGSSKRTVNYNWHAASANNGYWEIGYPGVLKNCETCHVAGSYDFSGTANAAAVPNRLYRVTATGTSAAATFTTSPYVAQTAGTDYGTGYSNSTGAPPSPATLVNANLVSSPIANACFSCHDSSTAQAHMNQDGGGSIYQARSTALAKTENCLFCHGSGKIVDIKVMHAQ